MWNVGKIVNFEDLMLGLPVQIKKLCAGVADPFILNGHIFAESIDNVLKGKIINPHEEKRFGQHKGGVIVGACLDDMEFKVVLKDADCHLSYPQVFSHKNRIFMLPESFQSRQLRLYECQKFPSEWRLLRVLKNMACCDSILFEVEKRLYIFTKEMIRNKTLLLEVENLIDGKLSIIADNILPDGYRGGGNIFTLGNRLFIPIQPSEVSFYGERLCIYEIENDLSFNFFCEIKKPQNIKALHHLSNCDGEFFCDFIFNHPIYL